MKALYLFSQLGLLLVSVVCFIGGFLTRDPDLWMLALTVLAMVLVAHAGEQQPRVVGSPLPPVAPTEPLPDLDPELYDEGDSTLLGLKERSDEHPIAWAQPSPYSA